MLVEAVQNHAPDVVIVDEIGTPQVGVCVCVGGDALLGLHLRHSY